MGGRYDCERCGANVDEHSNHESHCPGSSAERAESLEERVSDLEEVIEALRDELRELRKQIGKA